MKKLAIYMEQSSARLIEFTIDILKTKSELSCFDYFDEKHPKEKNLNHIEYQEAYLQNHFLNKLSEYILYYNEVLLFGKSNTTDKLFDLMAYDNRFYKINITIKQTEAMTFNEQNNFVSDYFLLGQL
ncbi:MAG: hypothetical protein KAX93_06935 [Flavobacterium sp.]|nr:hypothetical protein [Flavobacterium sp.]MBP8158096.1 hypothetical protein [Flavobacterium sp.]